MYITYYICIPIKEGLSHGHSNMYILKFGEIWTCGF